jgi:predicted AAA+ superfamily ATPase
VATGSSAFYIDKQFNDSLMGRKKIFQMGTLDFEEFLLFKGRNDLVAEVTDLKTKRKKKLNSFQFVVVLHGRVCQLWRLSSSSFRKQY